MSLYHKLCEHLRSIKNTLSFPIRIVITGNVAAGKTTLMNTLTHIFTDANYTVAEYPEFIAYDGGYEILQKRARGEVSVYEFQTFVIQCLDNEICEKEINIYERMPEDTCKVFCKYYYEIGKMTHDEYNTLTKQMNDMCVKHHLPRYTDGVLITLGEDLTENVHTVIEALMKYRQQTLVFYIRTTPEVAICRAKKRARSGEEELDIAYFKHVDKLYQSLFDEMSGSE